MRKLLLFIALFIIVVGMQAQQNDTLGVHLPETDELHVLASEDALPAGTADSYMRVDLDRQIKAGEWTLLVLPSSLDGYYFGANAERYKVTECDLTALPVSLTRVKMDDLDDFEPLQMYLVKSSADLDKIVSLVPGIATKVPDATGVTLMCLTLNSFEDATGVDDIQYDSNDRHGKTFDISGRMSKSVAHGICIVNGKKIFAR